MSQPLQNKSTNFGPYRAIFRALLLKCPDVLRDFLSELKSPVADVLNTEIEIPEGTIFSLWEAAQHQSSSQPLLALEAASLFQMIDLGERGWLLMTAKNLRESLSLLQKFFPGLKVELEEDVDSALIRWLPQDELPPSIITYFVTIFLSFLNGQGIKIGTGELLILPMRCKPLETQFDALLRERMGADYGIKVEFADTFVSFNIRQESLFQVLRSSDETLFQLYLQRCIKSQARSASDEVGIAKTIKIKEQIKQMLRRNLSWSHFGSRNVAEEIGVSVRTLERILAQEKTTLRALKQEVQQEAAEEMLAMGIRGKEVARRIGFENVAAFSRAFHQWTGVSPSQFRKKKCDEQ